MTPVFADTFYFVALLNESDNAHNQAVACSRDANLNVVTTPWILTEVADGFSSKFSRKGFLQLYDAIYDDSSVCVVPATQALFDSGIELYRNRSDKEWSLTDCISFVVMKERRITEALTGDHHFEQAGFKMLLK